MNYYLKKILFKTDNDFVLWEIAKSGVFIEKMMVDNRIRVTINNRNTTIKKFVEYHLIKDEIEFTPKDFTVKLVIGLAKNISIGKWQLERFEGLQKYLHIKYGKTPKLTSQSESV
jgi:hypothetical protein